MVVQYEFEFDAWSGSIIPHQAVTELVMMKDSTMIRMNGDK